MIARTGRQRALDKALTLLVPGAPFEHMESIRRAASARHLRHLPPSVSAWLAIIAHVRHRLTDYDQLLVEGYDRQSARHFTAGNINAVLTEWRATRLLDRDTEDESFDD
jgi:hypothetical protein